MEVTIENRVEKTHILEKDGTKAFLKDLKKDEKVNMVSGA